MANPSRGRPRLTGSVRRIRLRSSIGFGGATNSEFAEFLLHFPTEEIFQPMRYAEFFVKPSLAWLVEYDHTLHAFRIFHFCLSYTFRFDL